MLSFALHEFIQKLKKTSSFIKTVNPTSPSISFLALMIVNDFSDVNYFQSFPFIVNPYQKPYPLVCLRDPRSLTEVQDSGLLPPSLQLTTDQHKADTLAFSTTPTFFYLVFLYEE